MYITIDCEGANTVHNCATVEQALKNRIKRMEQTMPYDTELVANITTEEGDEFTYVLHRSDATNDKIEVLDV